MILKVAIIEPRESYRTRLYQTFSRDYSDKVEVSSFSSIEAFEEYVTSTSVDAMLVAESLADASLTGRRGATLIYLVDDKSIETIYGRPAISRYQKVELIYRSILSACSERFEHMTARTQSIESANIITFFPASGGAGASTMAAACAVAAARRGLKCFYLNLELYGQAELYFQGQGSGGLDDVLYAIEAKKSGVAMRIQGMTRKSSEGVCFLKSCANAIDIAELKEGHLEHLVREIATSDSYDIIVLDLDYAHSPLASEAMQIARKVVFVSNGTEVSNSKFERLYQMLDNQRRTGRDPGIGKMVLAYNSFSSKTGRKLASDIVPVAGGLNRVVTASIEQLIDTLSANPLFDVLLAQDLD